MLDRSVSMKAHDIQPSRFARATLEIRNFVRHKPEGIDRIALVGFADASVVLSYLTHDVDSVLFYFDWIDGDPTPLFGTNIGAALKSAIDVAKKDDRPTRKLFLIVSDGEDYGTELTRALATARAAGYRVNCIGIGADDAGADSAARAGRPGDVSARRRRPAGHDPLLGDHAPRDRGGDRRPLHALDAPATSSSARLAEIVAGERKALGWRTFTEYRDLYPAGLAVAAIAAAGLWMLL